MSDKPAGPRPPPERRLPVARRPAGRMPLLNARTLSGLLALRDRLLRRKEAAGVEDRIAQRPASQAPIPRPLHADWAWRPEAWTRTLRPSGLVAPEPGARLGTEIAVFHDCTLREMSLNQRPGRAGEAPMRLSMEVVGMSGDFLSLAIDLPAEALNRLGAGHILSAIATFAAASPVAATARLNLRQGPEQRILTRVLVSGAPAEFDLAAAGLDLRPISAGWLDLIFDAPTQNRIEIDDLTLTRRPRAAF